jgi:NAD(P)H dehydrogenase (quinone)
MDRVFVYGSVYCGQVQYDTGICKGKKMLACMTTGASEDSCSFNGREGDTRLIAWPLLFPFRYIGFDVFEPTVLHGIGGVAYMEVNEDGLSDIDRCLAQWCLTLGSLEGPPTISFNRDTEFDDTKRLVPGAPVYSLFVSHQSYKDGD